MALVWPNPFKRRQGKKKRFDLKEFARRMGKLEKSDEEKSSEQPNEKPQSNEHKKSSDSDHKLLISGNQITENSNNFTDY